MRSGAEVDGSLVGNQLEPVVKFSMGRGGSKAESRRQDEYHWERPHRFPL